MTEVHKIHNALAGTLPPLFRCPPRPLPQGPETSQVQLQWGSRLRRRARLGALELVLMSLWIREGGVASVCGPHGYVQPSLGTLARVLWLWVGSGYRGSLAYQTALNQHGETHSSRVPSGGDSWCRLHGDVCVARPPTPDLSREHPGGRV